MKPAGLLLTLLLVAPLVAAEQAALPVPAETAKPDAAPKLSPEVSQLLTEKLPKYSPPAPEKPKAEPNPDVLELPKVTVTQKKRPRLTDQVMMTTKAFNEKLAKEKLSSFDRNFLNKFSLPAWFGGVSAAERARDEYDRDQREKLASDVFLMAKAVEKDDPEQAKALRDAISRP